MTVVRRGDDIPPVSDYAHWNEDAQRVWYEENRYDMEHADEIVSWDDDDHYEPEEPEPFSDVFDTEAEARAWAAKHSIDIRRDTISQWRGLWYVEHYNEQVHDEWLKLEAEQDERSQ